jgi:hypothetical protein
MKSLERAIAIAVEAHAGVADKAGSPYVLHPLRMMLRMETEAEMMAAVLHDVVEDGDGWTLKRLAAEGIPPVVVEAVRFLTKRPEEEPAGTARKAGRSGRQHGPAPDRQPDGKGLRATREVPQCIRIAQIKGDPMATIIVDPEDLGTQTGTWTVPTPDFKPTPIREQLDEAIDPAGDCCVHDGRPCILFGDWDYAEDWSGEFVREMHPFALIGAPKITVDAFWRKVRQAATDRDLNQNKREK